MGKAKPKGMFPNCFTCPHEVIQYDKHLLNDQNQEMEPFRGTKFLPHLEVFSGIEGEIFRFFKLILYLI